MNEPTLTSSYTEAMFRHYTKEEPENDDMDRATCLKAGKIGHWSCGICIHLLPVFKCHECFCNNSKPDFKRITAFPILK